MSYAYHPEGRPSYQLNDRQSYHDQDQYQQTPSKPRSSYYDPTSPNDEPFDVRADFDGTGPRWSDRYGQQQLSESRRPQTLLEARGMESNYGSERGYKPVDDHVAPSGAKGDDEMISVPVLGPEWKKNELYELSKKGKSEMRSEKRTLAWRTWNRGQSGLCGVKWLTKKLLVFGIFFFLAALGVLLYFVIPRNPSFQFYPERPFDVDNSTISFSRTPTNFSFNGNLNLYADSTSSYLPVQFSHLEAKLYDLTTNKVIATGDLGKYKVPRGSQEPVILPVTFSYSALNATDMTWNNMYAACGHLWPGTVRPDMKLRLVLESSIVGLTSKPAQSTQISDITCPFELSEQSV